MANQARCEEEGREDLEEGDGDEAEYKTAMKEAAKAHE
jgi:hypothetical protein